MLQPIRPYLTSAALVAAVVLGSCSDSNDTNANDTASNRSTTSTTLEERPASPGDTNDSPPDMTEPSTSSLPSAPAKPGTSGSGVDLTGLPEYQTLQEKIADLDALEPIVETDNPGTRVILFENPSGQKVYKSVFVKRENRLKIIDLGGGPPLYDAPL